jgi:hypothetical protein
LLLEVRQPMALATDVDDLEVMFEMLHILTESLGVA